MKGIDSLSNSAALAYKMLLNSELLEPAKGNEIIVDIMDNIRHKPPLVVIVGLPPDKENEMLWIEKMGIMDMLARAASAYVIASHHHMHPYEGFADGVNELKVLDLDELTQELTAIIPRAFPQVSQTRLEELFDSASAKDIQLTLVIAYEYLLHYHTPVGVTPPTSPHVRKISRG